MKLLLLLSHLIILMPLTAMANIQVFPTKLLLNDQNKAGYLGLRNKDSRSHTYKISAVYYKMLPNGKMVLLKNTEDPVRSAVKMLKFSPRRVTLEADSEQTVRVIVQRPANLTDGEYIGYLLFETEDEQQELNSNPSKTKSVGVAMKLEAKVSVAIPIIFRHGAIARNIKIENIKLQPKKKDKNAELSFDLLSEGNSFAYGELHLKQKAPDNQKENDIEVFYGINSFLPKRSFHLSLDSEKYEALKSGTMILEYKLNDSDRLVSILEKEYTP